MKQMDFWRIGLVIFQEIGDISRKLVGFGSDAFIVMLCLTLWIPARRFAKGSAREQIAGELGMRKLLETYEALKDISEKINGQMGQLIFSWLLEGLIYFSLALKDVLTLDQRAIPVGVFFLNFIITIYFAADICKLVGQITIV
jgi:hypothetical protein